MRSLKRYIRFSLLVFLLIIGPTLASSCLTIEEKDFITVLAVNSNVSATSLVSIFEKLCLNVTITDYKQNISDLYNKTSDLYDRNNVTNSSILSLNSSILETRNTTEKIYRDIDNITASLKSNMSAGFERLYNATSESLFEDIRYDIMSEVSNKTREQRNYINTRFEGYENITATREDLDLLKRDIINNQSYTARDITVQQGNTQFYVIGGFLITLMIVVFFVDRRLKGAIRKKMGLSIPISESHTVEELTVDTKLKARMSRINLLKKKVLSIDKVRGLKIGKEAKQAVLNRILQGISIEEVKIPEELYFAQKEQELNE